MNDDVRLIGLSETRTASDDLELPQDAQRRSHANGNEIYPLAFDTTNSIGGTTAANSIGGTESAERKTR